MTEPQKDNRPYTARVAAVFSEITRRLQNPAVPEQGLKPGDAKVFPEMLEALANNPDKGLTATYTDSFSSTGAGNIEMYTYDSDTRRFDKQIQTIELQEDGQMVLFMKKRPENYPKTKETAAPQLRVTAFSLEPDSEAAIRRYYGGAKQLIDIAEETKHGTTATEWSRTLRGHVQGMEENIVVSRTTIAMERIFRPEGKKYIWEPQATVTFIERLNGEFDVAVSAQKRQDEPLRITGADAKAFDRWLTKVVGRQPSNR